MNRGCHDFFFFFFEMKMEGQSCLAKLKYYHSIKGNRFHIYGGMQSGDTCFFELVHEINIG